MSHREQREFCKNVRRNFRHFFSNKIVIDVGSLDINGNNRIYFRDCDYTGIDIIKGKNVDVVGPAHEVIPKINEKKIMQLENVYRHRIDFSHERPISTIISTECLEHDKHWELTLMAMYDYLKPGGLLLITCAGDGREEHGTKENHSWCSPATNDYYKNISNEMFGSVLRPEMFETYFLSQDKGNNDLFFYGIKK